MLCSGVISVYLYCLSTSYLPELIQVDKTNFQNYSQLSELHRSSTSSKENTRPTTTGAIPAAATSTNNNFYLQLLLQRLLLPLIAWIITKSVCSTISPTRTATYPSSGCDSGESKNWMIIILQK